MFLYIVAPLIADRILGSPRSVNPNSERLVRGSLLRSNVEVIINRCKREMDSFDKLKRPPVWASSISGILSLAMDFFSQSSGAGNAGEERGFFRLAFPGGVEYVIKRRFVYSIFKLKRPPVWASILGILSLLMKLFSQSSGAANTGESATFAKPAKKRYDARGIDFFILLR